jgi:hypothetical protein
MAAMKMSGQGDVAIRKMIGSMTAADLAAAGASVRIDALGNKVITLPNGKEITVSAKDLATPTIQSIAGRNYSAVIKLYGEFVGYSRIPSGAVLSGSSARGNADGGWIRGPGTRRSDSIPRMLSNEEFVVNADDANKGDNPAILENINSGRSWNAGMSGTSSSSTSSAGGGRSGGGGAVTVTFAGNTDTAFATAFKKLVRDGLITIS